MESSRPRNDNSDRLTFNDLGVQLENLKPEPKVEPLSSKEKHRATALVMTGAMMLSGASLMENLQKNVDPINEAEPTEQSLIEISDLAPGDELEVSGFSYTVTGGNVRTSPEATADDDNLAQGINLAGVTLEHPMVVPDENNPKNGMWYVFYDSEGKKFSINGQNVVKKESPSDQASVKVTVDSTTNQGIFAHDGAGHSLRVASVTQG